MGKQNLQLRQNQIENKIKKLRLAFWFNDKRAIILYSPTSAQCCETSIMPACFNYKHSASSAISSAAHHNPHISVFVVCLLIQELIVSKIYFLKFLSISDKPRLDQLKIITASRSTNFSESFHPYRYKEFEMPTRKWKCPVLRTYTKSHQLIKHTKISYSIASLVFPKRSCVTYQNALNRGTSKYL